MDNKNILSIIVPVSPEFGPPSDDITQYDVAARSLMIYNIMEMVDSIESMQFKSLLSNIEDEIDNLPFPYRKELCVNLISKIREVYNIDVEIMGGISSDDDIKSIIDLCLFLTHDHIKFLTVIYTELNIENFDDIENYIDENREVIISLIDRFSVILKPFCRDILLTLQSDKLINLIKKLTKQSLNKLIVNLKVRKLKWTEK